jgi:hypothetical protein
MNWNSCLTDLKFHFRSVNIQWTRKWSIYGYYQFKRTFENLPMLLQQKISICLSIRYLLNVPVKITHFDRIMSVVSFLTIFSLSKNFSGPEYNVNTSKTETVVMWKQCYGKEYAALSVTFSPYTRCTVRYCTSWNLCDNGLPSTKGNKIMHNKHIQKSWQHC